VSHNQQHQISEDSMP